MKIVIVHNFYRQPGGEDVVFQQEKELLRRMGHNVVTYCRDNKEIDSFNPIQRLVLLQNLIWATDTRKEVAELLRREKPDVVHVHNTFLMVSFSVFAACLDAGVPVVQTLHNYRLLCPAAVFFRNGHVCEECVEHSLIRSVLHGCYHESRPVTAAVALMLSLQRQFGAAMKDVDRLIALTEFSRRKFIEGGIPAEKLVVKPNFVYPDPCTRRSRGDYVLFVGRLSPEKRVTTLLSAWQKLRVRIPLYIIGGGPLLNELQDIRNQFGLHDIQFRGAISRQDTLSAMNGARFLVFCSEWYENFPCTLAEAFACRTPVIASRLGAMREIVEDGRTGLHFGTGDVDDLAAKIEWAWLHPDRTSEMGQEARREYEDNYTAERNYSMLMDIYEGVITSSSRVESGGLGAAVKV
jgi:glycosyltransferase involved in cell wall biosynthesis